MHVLPAVAIGLLSITRAAWGSGQTPSTEEQSEFLRVAKVVKASRVSTGVTGTWRLTLSHEGLRHDASFQSVDEHELVKELPDGTREIHFVDSYRYNVAAYRLARLLGLTDMVPVSVERFWRGSRGAMTWWVDDVWMDDNQRDELGRAPPDPVAWSRQIYRVRVFAQLIHDTDRNRSNILITRNWDIWMIDFTRAFRRSKELRSTEDLNRCSEDLFETLRGLSRERFEESLSEILRGVELDGLVARAARLVEHFERLIEERGREQVLY